MARCAERYGPTFTLRLAGMGNVVFVSDPAAIKSVFTGDAAVFNAGEGNKIMEPVLGPESLLLLDGPPHLRERRLLLPPFHGERMVRYRDVVREVAEQEIARWPQGTPFALQPSMQDITLNVILRAVFGMEEGRRLDHLRTLLKEMLDYIHTGLAMLPWLQRDWGWTPWSKFLRARAAADAVIYEEIERRRAAPDREHRDDVLSLLLGARDEDGSPMGDRQLRDELVSLLVAGHQTTAAALAWGFERIMRHPEVAARLRAEAGTGEDAYAEAVVKEILRLRPPIPIVRRRLSQPADVAGYRLPAGTLVAPCPHLAHRIATVYPDPEAFRPERFLDRSTESYSWVPFGGGVRRCVGASFATLEMKVVLHTVLARVELAAPDPGGEPVTRHAVTLSPGHGARAVVARRREPDRAAVAAGG
jgi:cytochrome P450